MKLQVMAVHDSKAQAFLLPFLVSRVEVAKRTFTDQVFDKNTQIGRNPSDFTLWHLGSWDDETAAYELFPQSKNLGHGGLFIKE